jgi:hypothetical protein
MGQPLDGALVGAGSLWPCHDSSNHDAKGLKMQYSLLSMHFICVLKVNVQISQEICCVALTLEDSALAPAVLGTWLVECYMSIHRHTTWHPRYPTYLISRGFTPEQWFFWWQIFTISRKRMYCHKFRDFKENPENKIQKNCPNWLQYERMVKIFYFHILNVSKFCYIYLWMIATRATSQFLLKKHCRSALKKTVFSMSFTVSKYIILCFW